MANSQTPWWNFHYEECCEKLFDPEDQQTYACPFLYRTVNRENDELDYNWLFAYYQAEVTEPCTQEQRRRFGQLSSFATRVFTHVRTNLVEFEDKLSVDKIEKLRNQ